MHYAAMHYGHICPGLKLVAMACCAHRVQLGERALHQHPTRDLRQKEKASSDMDRRKAHEALLRSQVRQQQILDEFTAAARAPAAEIRLVPTPPAMNDSDVIIKLETVTMHTGVYIADANTAFHRDDGSVLNTAGDDTLSLGLNACGETSMATLDDLISDTGTSSCSEYEESSSADMNADNHNLQSTSDTSSGSDSESSRCADVDAGEQNFEIYHTFESDHMFFGSWSGAGSEYVSEFTDSDELPVASESISSDATVIEWEQLAHGPGSDVNTMRNSNIRIKRPRCPPLTRHLGSRASEEKMTQKRTRRAETPGQLKFPFLETQAAGSKQNNAKPLRGAKPAAMAAIAVTCLVFAAANHVLRIDSSSSMHGPCPSKTWLSLPVVDEGRRVCLPCQQCAIHEEELTPCGSVDTKCARWEDASWVPKKSLHAMDYFASDGIVEQPKHGETPSSRIDAMTWTTENSAGTQQLLLFGGLMLAELSSSDLTAASLHQLQDGCLVRTGRDDLDTNHYIKNHQKYYTKTLYLGDMWRFRLDAQEWELLKPLARPSPRAAAVAWIDSFGTAFLFGGLQVRASFSCYAVNH
jgi:hypothetical protein